MELWEKVYEKLFGGFENLALTAAEDEDEEDELDAVPKSKKTKKGGYLKDGFVVDSEEEVVNSGSSSESDEFDDSEDTSEPEFKEEELLLDEIGSELSEESYE